MQDHEFPNAPRITLFTANYITLLYTSFVDEWI